MQFDYPTVLSFDDVLLVPQKSPINSRSDVDLQTQITKYFKLEIPLITTNMSTVTGIDMVLEMNRLGGMSVLHRFESLEEQIKKVSLLKSKNAKFAISLGIKSDALEIAKALVNAGANIINIDVAHGHLERTLETVRLLKNEFKDDVFIWGGIAATYEGARDLYEAGSDVVTVGVGGGSICTTRVQTGCGLPTFTSIVEAARAAKEYNRTVIPLAGIENSGMIDKALAAGACAIMAGNLFAGTDECPTSIVEVNGKKYKQYNGSTSLTEKTKHRESGLNKDKQYTKHVEGVEGFVTYKGPVSEVVDNILAGVRSGFSYCGATTIKELQEKAKFVRVTPAVQKENNFHDIVRNIT
ncbi:MAG: hypothetical protein QG570_660 [Patescibacteria group bacterium]|nr:hypothetical protein [Patescibacteria group bacterium]